MNIIENIANIIKNPNIYVAAMAGVIPGALTGGAIGALSLGYISNKFEIFSGCTDLLFGVNAGIIVAGTIGLVIGIILGGIVTGGFTIYKIHTETIHQLQMVSHENITEILFVAFSISIKISIGMGLGAIIGSLKLVGIGTALGAMMGTILILMLFLFTTIKKTHVSEQN